MRKKQFCSHIHKIYAKNKDKNILQVKTHEVNNKEFKEDIKNASTNKNKINELHEKLEDIQSKLMLKLGNEKNLTEFEIKKIEFALIDVNSILEVECSVEDHKDLKTNNKKIKIEPQRSINKYK